MTARSKKPQCHSSPMYCPMQASQDRSVALGPVQFGCVQSHEFIASSSKSWISSAEGHTTAICLVHSMHSLPAVNESALMHDADPNITSGPETCNMLAWSDTACCSVFCATTKFANASGVMHGLEANSCTILLLTYLNWKVFNGFQHARSRSCHAMAAQAILTDQQ